MNKLSNIIFILNLLIGLAEANTMNLTRMIYDLEDDFYSNSAMFYSKLKSTSYKDIEFVSKSIQGVPDNKFCISDHVKFNGESNPQMLLMYSVKDPNSTKIGYVVCVIDPYENTEKLSINETHNKNWIQGYRRFDVWHLSGKKWKVVIGVNPVDKDLSTWFKGNETTFFDDIDAASKSLKLKIKIDRNTENHINSEAIKAIMQKNK